MNLFLAILSVVNEVFIKFNYFQAAHYSGTTSVSNYTGLF